MSTATEYLTDPISEHIGETPEGFLVCKDVVLARTGYQKYFGRELPPKQLKALGLDIGPNEEIELYRSPEEVFRPGFMQSLESKPLTDDHPPGDIFVDSENVGEYGKGHIRNIHKGEDVLDSGDLPLRGDVFTTHRELAEGIISGKRGISLGYLYDLARNEKRIEQVNLMGNHAAVVFKGRAGGEARINDAAPAEEAVTKATATTTTKIKPKERTPMSKLMELLGLGLRAKAADSATTPDELAEAAGAISTLTAPAKSAPEVKAHAKDEEPEEKKEEKAKDAEPDEEGKRLHSALDHALASRRAKADSKDADIGQLKSLMDEYFTEEETEPEHAAKDAEHDPKTCEIEDCAKCKDAAEPEAELDAEKGEKKAMGKDSVPLVELLGEGEKLERGQGKDAAVEGAAVVLKYLRPFIARSKDTRLHRAFDAAAASVNKGASHTSKGSYREVAAAADARGKDAEEQMTPAQRVERLNKMMANHHRKNTLAEVK